MRPLLLLLLPRLRGPRPPFQTTQMRSFARAVSIGRAAPGSCADRLRLAAG
jgi:hypothetical protein